MANYFELNDLEYVNPRRTALNEDHVYEGFVVGDILPDGSVLTMPWESTEGWAQIGRQAHQGTNDEVLLIEHGVYDSWSLAKAGWCYIQFALNPAAVIHEWPLPWGLWQPDPEMKQNLIRGGALIAKAIDLMNEEESAS